MKSYRLLNCLLIIALLLAGSEDASSKNMMLKESLKKGFLSLKAMSRGGYMGKCLKLDLKNNTTESMTVKVDPALIFVPDKPQFQHLVAVGEEEIFLKPNEEKSLVLQTFCGKSSASSPAVDVNYKYWKQGDTTMVLASRYIRDHGLFNGMGQHAIWMFTDHHCLSNVYDPGAKSAVGQAFVQYLSSITGFEVPEYYTFHKINNGINNEVFDVDISKVYVDIDWNKESRRNLSITVYNKKGEVYRRIETGQVSNSKGEHNVKIAFDPLIDPLGVYYVQLKDDENDVWVEKRVVLQKSGCH